MFGKCGWIQNYQVVLVAHTIQVFESIFGKSGMAGVTGEIQFYILVREVNSLGGTVYRMYQFGITTHTINREATGITEHIQHRTSVSIAFQQCAVLALIHEEARLLSFQPVDMEF